MLLTAQSMKTAPLKYTYSLHYYKAHGLFISSHSKQTAKCTITSKVNYELFRHVSAAGDCHCRKVVQETLIPIPTVTFDWPLPKFKQFDVLNSQTFTATVQLVTPIIVFNFVSFPLNRFSMMPLVHYKSSKNNVSRCGCKVHKMPNTLFQNWNVLSFHAGIFRCVHFVHKRMMHMRRNSPQMTTLGRVTN